MKMKSAREELIRIEGYSGSDGKGKAFGLDGDQYLPILLSLIVTILMLGLMVIVSGGLSAGKGTIASLPFLLTLSYVLKFVFHKPPEYRRDFFEKLISGKDYYTKMPVYRSPLHSLLEANRITQKARKAKPKMAKDLYE